MFKLSNCIGAANALARVVYVYEKYNLSVKKRLI